MNNLILIIPYFGKWPKYFGFYLQSLKGRCFDLLLVTDLQIEELCLPDNVRVLKMNIAELATRMQSVLGENIVLESPLRLCDFKPMYGRIFEEFIKDYPYWAFGDCDLVYGRAFDSYLEDKFQLGFDALSLHPIWPTGSFFAMRNCDKMNHFYERVNGWRDICALPDKMYVNFDEIGGNFYQALREGRMTLADCAKIRDSLGAALDRADDIEYVRDNIHSETWLKGEILEVNDEQLTLNGREIPLFHFVLCKSRRYFKFKNFPSRGCSRYRVTDTGFYIDDFSWRFHPLIDFKRKAIAAIQSLFVNGLQRLFK